MMTEAEVIEACLIAASQAGGRLFRNNVGAGTLQNGKYMRWGLANSSHALNQIIKSSDLIGIKPVLIKENMVGKIIGQFWAIECKKSGWKYTGSEHQAAQKRWLDLIIELGGCAEFNSGEKIL